jgi:malate dehydrogenase (oxaloacetate-decarboxylating)
MHVDRFVPVFGGMPRFHRLFEDTRCVVYWQRESIRSREVCPMPNAPSPSYRITIRVKYANEVGKLASLTLAIAEAGGSVGAVDIVKVSRAEMIRDVTVDAADQAQEKTILAAIRSLPGVEVIHTYDRTFLMHRGGKIEVQPKSPVRTWDDLSMAYTPGVARVSEAIAEDPNKAHTYTIKRNTVAIVTDGSAVLGLGNVGPLAALPVMEGKAMLFKEFGGVNAFPICLSTQETEEIIRAVKMIAPTFGGINLEDISAPRCFEIEDRLRAELDIPVFHDDQHGTAAVVLAALFNAAKLVEKSIGSMRAVVLGAGAAGVACTKALMAACIGNVIVCDRSGAIYMGRTENMNSAKQWLAENTNRDRFQGSVQEALQGADLFLGVSGPNVLKGEDLKVMSRDAIVFALANPDPEIMPEEAAPYVRVMATGRSDYPNQINNVLCFPGLFKGLLDTSARQVTQEMVTAASRAIASVVEPDELSEDYIIPSVFDRRVAPAVAKAVAKVAVDSGLARRSHHSHE